MDVWQNKYKTLHQESMELMKEVESLSKKTKSILSLMTDNADNTGLVSGLKEQYADTQKALERATAKRNLKERQEYNAAEVVNVCVHFLKNPSELWEKSQLEDKIRIQYLICPSGLRYDVLLNKRTPDLSQVFAAILPFSEGEYEMAEHIGHELPVLSPIKSFQSSGFWGTEGRTVTVF